jgi:NhaP-type Na+/H+ or K+/H+ antiporter
LVLDIAVVWDLFERLLFSLTVVRMLPVFLVLGGLQLGTGQKLFMCWFVPKGLASIVFAVIVINAHLPSDTTLSMTVVCTILLSIVGHGLSANPLVALLAKRLSESGNCSTNQTN